MEEKWENAAQYLLRNRSIRAMVDDVLNSLEEIDDSHLYPVRNEEHENKDENSAKKMTKRLGIAQRQRLAKQYKLERYITEEAKQELARELTLPKKTVANWFRNRRKRETLRSKRNGTMINLRQQRRNTLKNCNFINQRNKIDNQKSMEKENVSSHLNTDNGMVYEVNDDNEIVAVKKVTKNIYRKSSSSFIVTQDENGVCILHEV